MKILLWFFCSLALAESAPSLPIPLPNLTPPAPPSKGISLDQGPSETWARDQAVSSGLFEKVLSEKTEDVLNSQTPPSVEDLYKPAKNPSDGRTWVENEDFSHWSPYSSLSELEIPENQMFNLQDSFMFLTPPTGGDVLPSSSLRELPQRIEGFGKDF